MEETYNAFGLYDMGGNACEVAVDYNSETDSHITNIVGGDYDSEPEDISILSTIEHPRTYECTYRLVLAQ